MLPILFLAILSLSSTKIHGASPHIVGGKDADEGEWPWQLVLYINSKFQCGASIIEPNWAVTAAHCVERPGQYSVKAGTNDNTQSCQSGKCQERIVAKKYIHPEYQRNSSAGFPNDIALVTWTEPIPELSGKVKYVKRAEKTDQPGKKCYITGWGQLRGFGPYPTKLQEAEIDVLTRAECIKLWSPSLVSDKHVCVMDKKTQARGSCNGDSGGPLVCEESPNKWELVGATSWGAFACPPTKPSVYTRISSYKSWIDSIIKKP